MLPWDNRKKSKKQGISAIGGQSQKFLEEESEMVQNSGNQTGMYEKIGQDQKGQQGGQHSVKP